MDTRSPLRSLLFLRFLRAFCNVAAAARPSIYTRPSVCTWRAASRVTVTRLYRILIEKRDRASRRRPVSLAQKRRPLDSPTRTLTDPATLCKGANDLLQRNRVIPIRNFWLSTGSYLRLPTDYGFLRVCGRFDSAKLHRMMHVTAPNFPIFSNISSLIF